MASIKRLDQSVVVRIQAGEVIRAPQNAVKEMLENSIDAGATNISVILSKGGLKLIKLTDNGGGIKKEDLAMVCERHCTSKLKVIDDLKSIATYGFRGEALASISHVARVTITSATKDQKTAFKAVYQDGKMTTKPTPTHGKIGTMIQVEDLFYNATSRRRGMNETTQYKKVFDVIQRYALHNTGVGFTLKKSGTNKADIHTRKGLTVVDNIATLFGHALSKSILTIAIEDKKLKFSVDARLSKPEYSSKKSCFVLFINHRLVSCKPLKRAVDAAYSSYISRGSHPFVYISLQLEPSHLDVNVHPAKEEVRFLHEQGIIDIIRNAIIEKLKNADVSRPFNPSVIPATAGHRSPVTSPQKSALPFNSPRNSVPIQRTSPAKHVSNDTASPFPASSKKRQLSMLDYQSGADDDDFTPDGPAKKKRKTTKKSDSSVPKRQLQDKKVEVPCVQELLEDVKKQGHKKLTDVFCNHHFVGIVPDKDDEFVVVQQGGKIYMCNADNIVHELVYQTALQCFGRFTRIELSHSLSIYELCKTAITADPSMTQHEGELTGDDLHDISDYVKSMLIDRREMLELGWNIDIDEEGNLKSLPLILQGYIPSVAALSNFVLRLGIGVDWENEKEYYDTCAREFAEYYKVHLPQDENDSKKYKNAIRNIFFPLLKENFVPPKRWATDGTIYEIATSSSLKKMFERC